MSNKRVAFELNDKQQKKYEEWIAHIRAIHGKVGNLTWCWSTNGIGDSITVYSETARAELDLTDIDSW